MSHTKEYDRWVEFVDQGLDLYSYNTFSMDIQDDM